MSSEVNMCPGVEPPRRERVVIGGCARDVENHLAAVFRNIEALAGLFEECAIIIHTDPSEDGTWRVLEEMERRFQGKMLLIKGDGELSEPQTHRLATARNAILDVIFKRFADHDYFFNFDLDEVCHRLLLPGTILELLERSDWDAVSFDRIFYYDLWALSFEPWIHNYDGHKLEREKGELGRLIRNIRNTIISQLAALKPGELLPVYSAFNGFAIYRISKISGCRYDGSRQHFHSAEKYAAYERATGLEIDLDRIENCEHVSFHWDMICKHTARIRISPRRAFQFIDHDEYLEKMLRRNLEKPVIA